MPKWASPRHLRSKCDNGSSSLARRPLALADPWPLERTLRAFPCLLAAAWGIGVGTSPPGLSSKESRRCSASSNPIDPAFCSYEAGSRIHLDRCAWWHLH